MKLSECSGPVMDPQCGVWECPDGSHEPDEDDCARCQGYPEDEHDR